MAGGPFDGPGPDPNPAGEKDRKPGPEPGPCALLRFVIDIEVLIGAVGGGRAAKSGSLFSCRKREGRGV